MKITNEEIDQTISQIEENTKVLKEYLDSTNNKNLSSYAFLNTLNLSDLTLKDVLKRKNIFHTLTKVKGMFALMSSEVRGKINKDVDAVINDIVNTTDALENLIRCKTYQNLKNKAGNWIKTKGYIEIKIDEDKTSNKKIACYVNPKVPGLMIHNIYNDDSLWTVTHIDSKRMLTSKLEFVDLDKAIRFVEETLSSVSWDIPREDVLKSEEHKKILETL